MSEVEDTVKRIQAHKGVMGVSILNAEGITIRTTLDANTAGQYSSLINVLTNKVKNVVRDLDPQNDLTFLRIRTKKHEIMIAPDREYTMVVIQEPNVC